MISTRFVGKGFKFFALDLLICRFFFFPTPQCCRIQRWISGVPVVTGTQHGHGCCHGALGMVGGHPVWPWGTQISHLGLGLRDFFSANNFRDLPERLCIRNYQFCRAFVPSGPGVFMFDCQKQILSSCRHNPHNFFLCLCPPLSTGLVEAGTSIVFSL